METTGTTRPLRVVRPGEQPPVTTGAGELPGDELSTEDYWARVQALRDDLARLRPAN